MFDVLYLLVQLTICILNVSIFGKTDFDTSQMNLMNFNTNWEYFYMTPAFRAAVIAATIIQLNFNSAQCVWSMELHIRCDTHEPNATYSAQIFFLFLLFFVFHLFIMILWRPAVHQMKLFSPFWAFWKGSVDTRKKNTNLTAIKTMNKLPESIDLGMYSGG